MDVIQRAYDPERDQDALLRIWEEIGWTTPDEDKHQEAVKEYSATIGGCVVEVNGNLEVFALIDEGDLRYKDEVLSLGGVMAVATGRVARRQGLAGRTTARAVAQHALDGRHLAGLGMFDQGYYDKLGFGTVSYDHEYQFDPASLAIRGGHRVPRRLQRDDYQAIHAGRLKRRRGHGSVSIHSPLFSRVAMTETGGAFGLGYFDAGEEVPSHHLIVSYDPPATHGPYRLEWMAYETPEQLRELLSLVKSFGDQVRSVTYVEPPEICLQDLVKRPEAMKEGRRGGKHAVRGGYNAWQQIRMLDLETCLARTHLDGEPVRFNLLLEDPIERYLDETSPWRGIGGDYVVTLGPTSGIEHGADPALPLLETDVSAFTRLWLGVRSAWGLSCTANLAGPESLLADLDQLLRLPTPQTDWVF